ncbi:hypothetical protein XENOCAPTIV_011457 [Xenoophorus captivus]|uniref:Secreted protein n=1 Tax=Xenoophorus captivus TaxID=1517983 RepID=A0ABV0R032_9TELE
MSSCVCFSLPLSLCLSLPSPPPRSVAAVLVMAVRPWCKLAVGSQVARMTVIDVQVFSSSHTGTLEPHIHTNTHLQRCIVNYKKCAHTHKWMLLNVVHMHTQNTCKLSCFSTILHINCVFCILVPGKCKQHTNKYN